MRKKLSIVVPCYNEQDTVEKFYSEATQIFSKIDIDYEIIFVNDGSSDKTPEKLSQIALNDERIIVINFSRNFGQQAAILCGFRHASGDCAIEMDCDLQDPLEVVPLMLEKWKEGYEVVHGRRIQRKGESFFKKATANIYYKFLAKICGFKMPRNTGDFKLLDRKVLDIIANMSEHDKYLRGLEAWVGFKQTFVDFNRNERTAGNTHYSLKKMVNLAKSGIVSNSNYPLGLSFKGGLFFSITAFLGFVALIVLSILKINFDAVLWLIPTIVILFGFNLFYRSVTDMYIGKVYEEVKNRPEYIIGNTINLDKNK